MGKINLLSDEMRNRIAAGEVIERPFSAVKELIENSIDAGSTEIEIYIERGGKDLIKIVDNGCGIEEEDMRLALISHATSKVSVMQDIDHIHTLGFRGEALASISSIACVELLSAVEGKEGHKVESDGEFIGKCQPAVANKGTQITVTKFFFNTPVRYKFMKSDKKEEADITATVTHYILGYPHIAFKYFVDGKLTLQSYGGGLEEAITQVYGAKVLPNCFKISAERNDIKIKGYISNQNYFKSNKTYQSLYLNGRYVVNPIITGAITNAYSAYAMKRQYPFYVLFMEMSDEIVDVNVHPNKLDVRFVDNSLIYGTVYKVISEILDGTAKAAGFVVMDENEGGVGASQMEQPVQQTICAGEFNVTEKVHDKDFSDVVGMAEFLKETVKPEPAKPRVDDGFDYSPYENYEAPAEQPVVDMQTYRMNAPHLEVDGEEDETTISVCGGIDDPVYLGDLEAKKMEQQRIIYEQCKYRGTLFNTYLMYEMKDEVYIIDQHAAHERLLYDNLLAKYADRKVKRQGLLVPYTLYCSPEEHQFITENLDLLWRLGFHVEPFGTSAFRVNEIPADLPNLCLTTFFDDFMWQIGKLSEIKFEDMIKEKIAQTACKHAIKGGDVLTEQEREALLEKLRGNMGLKCPHGRPICVVMTKKEVEKMFKRRV